MVRWFLIGMLAGVTLMGAMWVSVDTYKDLNDRISNVEGYLAMMNRMRTQ